MKSGYYERLGAWCSLGYLLVFGLGWAIMSMFWPPFSPALSPAETADAFGEDRGWILLGSVLMQLSTMALMVFSAMLVLVVRTIEGRFGILTLTLAFTCITYQVQNFYVGFSMSMATFRPDRTDELVQYAGDTGFMQFMGGIAMFELGWIITAIAALAKNPPGRQILPRWFGYVNLWAAILYIPELLIFFFKTGPFAWDGLFGYWIPTIVFIAYFIAAWWAFLQVARNGGTDPVPGDTLAATE